MKKLPIKKADIVLFVLFLLIGFGSILVFTKAPKEDALVMISLDGEGPKPYASLSEDVIFDVKGNKGYNTVEVKDGRVRVVDADCNGKDCVDFGWIDKEGQTIICIPHKLIVTIQSNAKEHEIDAVVR